MAIESDLCFCFSFRFCMAVMCGIRGVGVLVSDVRSGNLGSNGVMVIAFSLGTE